ncbi:MAG TPA: hypothetical protein VJ761_16675, partial [Ktedonobacteraceae bacterium]|nr:hypothetical protein [Ktedonobacteraceae bacterium]
METPHAFNVLVQSLKDRKKYNDPPYSLLLSSTIVLTPDVLQEICDARDWNSFSDFVQDRPLADRISMLHNHLD